MIKNLIKRGLISLGIIDNKNFQTAQVTYMGKTKNIQVVHDYGFSSNCPTGGIVLMFNVQGQEENIAGIADLPNSRIKNLLPGESVLYNSLSGAYVKMKSDGNIEINTANDVDVTCNNLNAVCVGNASITGVNITLTGNVFINGSLSGGTPSAPANIDASSAILSASDIIVNGKNIDGHVHGGVTTGLSDTGAF